MGGGLTVVQRCRIGLEVVRGVAGLCASRMRAWCCQGPMSKTSNRGAARVDVTTAGDDTLVLLVQLADGAELAVPIRVAKKGGRPPVWLQFGSSSASPGSPGPAREVTRRMRALTSWDIPREWDPRWVLGDCDADDTNEAKILAYNLLEDSDSAAYAAPLTAETVPGPFWRRHLDLGLKN
jgi:hypothetical protein